MKVFAVQVSPDESFTEVFIDDVLKMKKENFSKFKTLKFYTINSYKSGSDNSLSELIAVKGQKKQSF